MPTTKFIRTPVLVETPVSPLVNQTQVTNNASTTNASETNSVETEIKEILGIPTTDELVKGGNTSEGGINYLELASNSTVNSTVNSEFYIPRKSDTYQNSTQQVTPQQLQEFINAGNTDLSIFAGCTLECQQVNFGYATRNLCSDLNAAGTNFFQVFDVNGYYFLNCDFANCSIGNSSDITFDGCNLDRCDLSGTRQIDLRLGREPTIYPELFATDPQPTNFTNVKLNDTTFNYVSDDYSTNYEGTNFAQTKIIGWGESSDGIYDYVLSGKNLDLTGCTLKDSFSGKEIKLTNPLSGAEVAAKAGWFVEAILHNNLVVPPASGKKFVIAIASGAGNSTATFGDECVEMFGLQYSNPVPNQNLQDIVAFYNSQYAERNNLKFVVDAPEQARDFTINFCLNPVPFPFLETGSSGLFQGRSYIGITTATLENRSLLLRGFNKAIGASSPDESGEIANCSPYATVMCNNYNTVYNTGVNVMMALGKGNEVLTLTAPDDLGLQGHLLSNLVFGANPNYVPHNMAVNLTQFNESRVFYGDAGYDNSINFKSADLPEGTKYFVLDAATSIGTCFKIPCDPANLSAGINGTMVVFCSENQKGELQVEGSVLACGAGSNSVVVDGQVVEPINPSNYTKFPTSSPVVSPSFSPTNSHPAAAPTSQPTAQNEKDRDLVKNLIIGGAVVAGVFCASAAAFHRRRNSARYGQVAPDVGDVELAVVPDAAADEPEIAPGAANQNDSKINGIRLATATGDANQTVPATTPGETPKAVSADSVINESAANRKPWLSI